MSQADRISLAFTLLLIAAVILGLVIDSAGCNPLDWLERRRKKR